MKRFFATVLLTAVFFLLIQGCASTIQVKGPIPPMEQIDAMTSFLMDQFILPDSLREQVREVVKTNAQMKKTIRQMAAEGRIVLYDAERQRIHRFEGQLGALLTTPEEKAMLRPVIAAVRRSETELRKKWPDQNMTPVINDMGE